MTAPNRPARRRRGIQAQVDQRRTELQAQVRAAREHFDETQERINARTGRNLLFAVVVGLALGGGMILSLVFVKQLFLVIAALLIGFGAVELAGALRHAGRDVPRTASVIAAVLLLPVTYWLGGVGQWLGIAGAILFVTLWRLAELALGRGARERNGLLLDLGAGAFIQLYVALLGSCAVALTARDGGEWWTLAFLVIVVATDVGAYASGLTFGKHPMAPRISPKKTWEGFAGSVLAALIAGVLLAVFALGQPWWFGLILGAVLVVTATVGDLTESLIKRDLGIKDISSWLPGHGGFLDRLDSILPSAAAAYALFLLVG
ncbi:phosphatidate cytidylyltransferase [Naasia aerilata]|uniref:Phosphatidate cytidylyltransferase n=1 Tax=Naasia aerilata TaxID=1162966 RepID=A0ABM8GDL9_9MICO|nr:phosphatidate cytidylyltransferase [Naasia aerilata]BDZ46380.1 phosphatidate cytidylyltransferase [Naasia aerilata]